MSRIARVALALVLTAPRAAAQTHLVVVTGLSGEPQFAERHRVWASAVMDAAQRRFGVQQEDIAYLAEQGVRPAAGVTPRLATAQNVTAELGEIAARAAPDAVVLIVLFGHGSAIGGRPRFHLPGPDLTADALATALDALATQQVVVVNAASASGDWLPALAGARRIVITATRSGAERLETKFGQFFAQGLVDGSADTDNDGRISVLEAFEYARLSVAHHYERANQLRTEHALLDDQGDGKGTGTPSAMSGQGSRAAWVFLDAAPSAGDPALRPLYARRDSLERAVADWRTQRDRLEPAAYERELERLLLELARVSRDIRSREGGQP